MPYETKFLPRATLASCVILTAIVIVVGFLWRSEYNAKVRAETLAQESQRLFKIDQQARTDAEAAQREALIRLREAREGLDVLFASLAVELRHDRNAQRVVLKHAAAEYRRIANETSKVSLDEFQVQRANAFMRLGDVHREMREGDASWAYDSGGELFRETIRDTKDEQIRYRARLGLAQIETKLGSLCFDTRDLDRAAALLEEAIRGLAAIKPTAADEGAHDEAVFVANANLAQVEEARGNIIRADELAVTSQQIAHKHWRELNETPRLTMLLGKLGMVRARIALSLRQTTAAAANISLAQDALRRATKTIDGSDNLPLVEAQVEAHLISAAIQRQRGDLQAEAAAYEGVVDRYRVLCAATPNNFDYPIKLDFHRAHLGKLLLANGEAVRAVEVLETAVAAFERHRRSPASNWELYQPHHAACQAALAAALGDAGENERAKAMFDESLTVLFKLSRNEDPIYRERLAIYLCYGAQLLHKLGDRTSADKNYRNAAELWVALQKGEDKPSYAHALAQVRDHHARLLEAQGDQESAERLRAEARAAWRKQAEERADREAWHCLVESFVRSPGESEEPVQRLLKEAEQHLMTDPPVARDVAILGCLAVRAGEHRRGIILLEPEDLRSPTAGRDLVLLAIALWRTDQKSEARRTLAAARQWAKAHQPDGFELKTLLSEADGLIIPE